MLAFSSVMDWADIQQVMMALQRCCLRALRLSRSVVHSVYLPAPLGLARFTALGPLCLESGGASRGAQAAYLSELSCVTTLVMLT